jgi:site-specific DNA recombinase
MAQSILQPAVGYFRVSTDRQETSIPDQRQAVVAHAAKHGYRLIREYCDDGISGDDTPKRAAFLKMMRDAQDLGDFQVILCWDQDRLGRFDSIEAGYWLKPLRDAGVRLETIAQGRIDWEDFAGRLIYTVQQEGKHAFLRDLSRNVTRGHLNAARQGLWQGGPVPYGYAVVKADQRLVPGSPEQVETVQWLFNTYAETSTSIRALTEQLNQRGVPGPTGGLWLDGTVHRVLTRPVYQGDMVWGRRVEGKYFSVRGGEVTVRKGRRGVRELVPEAEWTVKRDTHPALVDRETFEKVRRRLAANQGNTTPIRAAGNFLFSRLLFCGNCGAVMRGSSKHELVDKQGRVLRKYICGSYHARGRMVCSCNTVVESMILGAVVHKLKGWFTDPANRASLEEEIRRQLSRVPADDAGKLKSARTRLAELERIIRKGPHVCCRCPRIWPARWFRSFGSGRLSATSSRPKLLASML